MFLGDTTVLLGDSIVLQRGGRDMLSSGTGSLNEHLCLAINMKDLIFLELLPMNHYPPLVAISSLTILFGEDWLQGLMLRHFPRGAMKRPCPTLKLVFLVT